jgi:U3 small nucleolar RNA-associated protein 11
MSSLRNAVKRIAHKERSQPQKRQHLGILQKKKDYKKRADDYHRKDDRIRSMRQKASMKNPDEFYFGMHNSGVRDGKHESNTDYRDVPPEMIQLMKDQDLSYFRMQKQRDSKKAERLQASLHLLSSDAAAAAAAADGGGERKSKRKHTVFVDSKESAENFNVAEHFDTIPELAGRKFNRLRKQDIEKAAKRSATAHDEDGDDYQLTSRELEKQAKIQKKIAKKLAKARASSYGEMEARIRRAEAMQNAEDRLTTEKNVASTGRKRKVKEAEGGRPAQYKWRRKRLG